MRRTISTPGESPCSHQVEGVGDGFGPALLTDVRLEGLINVPRAKAMQMAKRLSSEFGLSLGTSSGANVMAWLQVARKRGPWATLVMLLCDRAERYFSTPLFERLDELTSARMQAMG